MATTDDRPRGRCAVCRHPISYNVTDLFENVVNRWQHTEGSRAELGTLHRAPVTLATVSTPLHGGREAVTVLRHSGVRADPKEPCPS